MKSGIFSLLFVLIATFSTTAQQGKNNRRNDGRARWEAMTPAERTAAQAKFDSIHKNRNENGDIKHGRGPRRDSLDKRNGNSRPQRKPNGPRRSLDSLQNNKHNVNEIRENTMDSLRKAGGFNRKRKQVN